MIEPAKKAKGASVTKGEQTRERIMAVASELFHAQGIDGTGLGEILKQAKAGKSQFYQHFASKEALICAVLSEWESRLLDSADQLSNLDDLKRWLYGTIEYLEEFRCERGCPIATIAASCDDNSVEAKAAVKHFFETLAGKFQHALTHMKTRGELAPETDIPVLVHTIMAAQQGAAALTKSLGTSAPAYAALDQTISHLRTFQRAEG